MDNVVVIGGKRHQLFGEVDSYGRCDAMELDSDGKYTGHSITVNIYLLS